MDEMLSGHREDFTVGEGQSRGFREVFWLPNPASSRCGVPDSSMPHMSTEHPFWIRPFAGDPR